MCQDGLYPDTVTFSALISSWAQEGYPEKAEEWFERMRQDGLQPNTDTDPDTYSILMNAWARKGSPEKAASLHERKTSLMY